MDNQRPNIYIGELLSALSYALDMTEGQPPGHCIRSCWIGTHVAKSMGLDREEQKSCYFTLLLKDSGCSSNAARLTELYCSDDRLVKHNFKTVDTDDVKQVAKFLFKNAGLSTGFIEKYKRIFQLAKAGNNVANELIATRCHRGANIARDMGLDESVAQGIYSLDEHYNGKGHSEGLQGKEIPIESRIALLSQCVDVFNEIGGKKLAVEQVQKRSGTWFDPGVVQAFLSVANDELVWQELESDDIETSLSNLFPENQTTPLSENDLHQVVRVYGTIVDAKSPFTSGHSKRVAKYAVSIGKSFGLEGKDLEFLHHAAALHDIGKLGISNTILDKPTKLNQQEWSLMKKHPAYSHDILSKLDGVVTSFSM